MKTCCKVKFPTKITDTYPVIRLFAGGQSKTGNIWQQVDSSRMNHIASASPCQNWKRNKWFSPMKMSGNILWSKERKGFPYGSLSIKRHPRLHYQLVFFYVKQFSPPLPLSSTLQIAIGHMAQFRVTLPERSYLPAAERTDPPLWEVEGKNGVYWSRTDPDFSCCLKKENSSKADCFLPGNNLFTCVTGCSANLLTLDLNWFSWVQYDARLISHLLQTCCSTFDCKLPAQLLT